jgi:hypothetical protein
MLNYTSSCNDRNSLPNPSQAPLPPLARQFWNETPALFSGTGLDAFQKGVIPGGCDPSKRGGIGPFPPFSLICALSIYLSFLTGQTPSPGFKVLNMRIKRHAIVLCRHNRNESVAHTVSSPAAFTPPSSLRFKLTRLSVVEETRPTRMRRAGAWKFLLACATSNSRGLIPLGAHSRHSPTWSFFVPN